MEQDSTSHSFRATDWPTLNSHHRIKKIAEQEQRTSKNTIYKKEDTDRTTALKYVFPATEVILLNLMRLLEQKIIDIYEEDDYEADSKKYFAFFKTGKEYKECLCKMYNVEEYSSFEGRPCEKVARDACLPEYVWASNITGQKVQIEEDLLAYGINFSYLDGNFLIEKGQNKLLEIQVVVQKIKNNKQDPPAVIHFVSNYLKVQLEQDDVNLLSIFSVIETQLTTRSTYRYCYPHSRMHFILELDNVFDMLATKSILLSKMIPFKYISKQLFLDERSKFKHFSQSNSHFNLDIPRIISEIRNADILHLEMHLNTHQGQFAKTVNFMLDNWTTCQPFFEDEMEMLQDILLAYSMRVMQTKEVVNEVKVQENQNKENKDKKQEPSLILFQNCDKRYTSMAQLAEWILPKLKAINQYNGDASQLIKKLSQNNKNHLFANYVSNAISMAARKGEIKIINPDKTQQPLYEHIAINPEYESLSRRAARWEHLFSVIGINHFNREREFTEQELACRVDYMNAIETEKLLDLKCFGCCPFFYEEQNIRDSQINQTPFKIIESTQKIEIWKTQIKQAMRYLMNHCGGVILFDCFAKHREVLPKGAKMSQEKQLQIQKTLKQYFEQQEIQDKDDTIIKSMLISFVPVVRNPLKQKLKNGKRSYIEETYVTRVRIDRKWNKDSFKDEQEEREAVIFGPKISCFHPGYSCSQPEQQIKKEKSDKGKQKKQLKQAPIPLKQRYPHISLVICKKQNRSGLNNFLRQNQFGEIETRYESYNFKCAVNTAILYHSTPLEEIKAKYLQKQSKQKQYGSRYKSQQTKQKTASFAKITLLIFLPDRSKSKNKIKLTSQDYRDMTEFSDEVKKQFQNEQVILWRYAISDKPKEEEYYFQLKCKLKSVLLYYILHSSSQKSKFRMPKECENFKDANKFFVEFKSAKVVKEEKQLRQQLLQIFKPKQKEQISEK